MTKALGAGDSVTLNCVLLLHRSGNTATSCVPLLSIPLLPPGTQNSIPGKMQSCFPPPLRSHGQTEARSGHCTLGNQRVYWVSFQNIGEGSLQGVGASPLNRPHLEGLYPPGMRASPRLHRWDSLPQLPPNILWSLPELRNVQPRNNCIQQVVGISWVLRRGPMPVLASTWKGCVQSTSPAGIILLQVGQAELPKTAGVWCRG